MAGNWLEEPRWPVRLTVTRHGHRAMGSRDGAASGGPLVVEVGRGRWLKYPRVSGNLLGEVT
jgi:hypothetical protein